jgi:acetyl-CoA synthetase
MHCCDIVGSHETIEGMFRLKLYKEIVMSQIPKQFIQLWSEIAEQTVTWMQPWHSVMTGDLGHGNVTWFQGGVLNVSVNCIDRHLPQKAEKTAVLWQGEEESKRRSLTFAQLKAEVCRICHVLRQLNVNKGDVVAIYLPMIPEALIAMLACTRIGAVHTVVFAGFSAQALRQRLLASSCTCLITADGYSRGGKHIDLKSSADEAIQNLNISRLIIKNTGNSGSFNPHCDYWWHELREQVPDEYTPEPMAAEDPLFILYTSGSTGQPKGVVHTTGGYLVQVTYSQQLLFQCQKNEVFWCTADVGWITGHSYVVYGPLANGVTTLIYEGIPTWPDEARNWRIIDDYKVNVFYTAPTAIRALMRAGDAWLADSSRASLRLLGTVGEPINPKAWQWFYEKVGHSTCPIVDTWWQTETGAAMIASYQTDKPNKPGAARQPLPGIVPVLLDDKGQEIKGVGEGLLAIKYPWPSMARTLLHDHSRYCSTYFKNGYYLTGDGAKRDEEGDYWINGRIDDVINVSGHRLSSAEIESALVAHPMVAEAAVVGVADELKGQNVCAFVVLKQGIQYDDSLRADLMQQVKKQISAIAKPKTIYCVDDLPKTRSGKVMRRILRQIVDKNIRSMEALGDLSTLANPKSVTQLLKICD